MLPEEITDFRRSERTRPPGLIGRPPAKIPKRPNSAIAGEVEEAHYCR